MKYGSYWDVILWLTSMTLSDQVTFQDFEMTRKCVFSMDEEAYAKIFFLLGNPKRGAFL